MKLESDNSKRQGQQPLPARARTLPRVANAVALMALPKLDALKFFPGV